MRTLRILIVPVLIFAGLLSTGCAITTDRQVIAQAAGMHNQIEPAVVEDPELAGYLQEIGNRVIQTARELDRQGVVKASRGGGEGGEWVFGQDMRFHFVNSDTLNAFTTGGNHMYIYTQLFREARTEDELAAVVAHEYAHVYARHVNKGMDRQYAALAAAAALGGAGYLAGGDERGGQYAALGATAGMLGGQFINMGFTRKDEHEADELGFLFYTRAGWDPDRFADFFQNMIDKGLDTPSEMLSSHPSLKNRVAETQQRVERLPPGASEWRQPPIADARRFKQLQARAEEIARTMPTDKTLANSQQLLQALPRSCLFPYTPEDEVQAREEIVERAEAAQEQQRQQAPPRRSRRSAAPAAPAPAAQPRGGEVISSPSPR